MSWDVAPKLERVRFAIVPDAITRNRSNLRRLGRRCINDIPMDSLAVLARGLTCASKRWEARKIQYLSFNLRPILTMRACARHRCSIDRPDYQDTARRRRVQRKACSAGSLAFDGSVRDTTSIRHALRSCLTRRAYSGRRWFASPDHETRRMRAGVCWLRCCSRNSPRRLCAEIRSFETAISIPTW